MSLIWLAVSFLTVIPVRLKNAPLPGDLGKSLGWFPLIGAVIGLVVGAAGYFLRHFFPPLAASVLTTAVWIGLTGGLHLDGLADCCDGMLNASSRERRLEIMKDPRLGTFGGIGLVLAILAKVAFLSQLPAGQLWLVVPLAAATGRWLLLPATRQPMARPGGLGAEFSGGASRAAWLPAAIVIGILTALAGWRGLLVVLAAHAVAWLVFRGAKGSLGGVTGDVFGLTVELAELVVLAGFCAGLYPG